MDINTGAQQDSRYPAAKFNEKGSLQLWGGDALTTPWGEFYLASPPGSLEQQLQLSM
jgi:hypothetical protein